jgi:hypothetical protein
MAFIESIREKEQALLSDLNQFYGDETNDYIKRRDELETFLDQLKSTCNLTEMVVKGKDIELLLLKKQLCEKFGEFQDIQLESVPRNISKKVCFIPGSVDLGKITEVGAALAQSLDMKKEDVPIFLNRSLPESSQVTVSLPLPRSNDVIVEENEEEFDDVEEQPNVDIHDTNIKEATTE